MLMRKYRWLHMVLLSGCLALPLPTWALGLGDLEVDSALNERLSGSIELLDSEGFQTAEVMVSLASREDFERVGVERFFYLTNIKFEVDMSVSPAVVKVSSAQPVSEPYLNFIVEVLWPRGRMLKEFTVLLDPPTFSEAAAPAVSAPAQTQPESTAQAPRPQPAPRTSSPRPGTRVDLAPATPAPATAPRQLPGDGVTTTRDDTLWKIAQRTLPSDRISVNQQMLAIQRKNPNAFIRNNINLLKAGYVLDIPSEAEAMRIDAQAATSDVAAQTEDWRTGGTSERVAANDAATQLIDDASGEAPALRSQVDASDRGAAPAATAGQTQGEVRIVANTGELASGTATGDDASVNQLIEEKETLARQVDELTYQLDREKDIAINQVTVKDRQLEVKDAEIAQLQQQMKEMREQLAQAAENQNQSPKAAQADSPWWMSPMVLLGVIGVLVLILVFALISARRNRAYDQNDDDTAADYEYENNVQSSNAAAGAAVAVAAAQIDTEEPGDVAEQTPGSHEPYIGDLEDAEDEDSVLEIEPELETDEPQDESEENMDASSAEAPGSSQTQTGDVIGEAEIYIAYGRYGQAANLLGGVLNTEPERWDVRLKLLEVYVESHDEEGFATHAQYIVDHCDDEDVLLACRELEAQFDNTHLDLNPDTSADEVTVTHGDESEQDQPDLDEDGFSLDLDDLENATTVVDTDAASEDTGLDFELEFDTDLEDAPAADAEEPLAADGDNVARGDELGGDLGLDFDPDKDVASRTDLEPLEYEPTSAQTDDQAAEADEGLEIEGLELDETTDETAVPAVEPEEDDFDFAASDDADINSTKLDLAEAYIDMGDADGAQEILREVLDEGSPEQQSKARELLDGITS